MHFITHTCDIYAAGRNIPRTESTQSDLVGRKRSVGVSARNAAFRIITLALMGKELKSVLI